MKRLTYRSISNLGPNDVAMLDIIRSCDRNNDPAGITGMLWFDGRFFLHAIEGPDKEVNALFLRLRRDPRHRALFVMDVRRIETRRYSDFGARFFNGIPAVDPLEPGILGTSVGPIHCAKAKAAAPSYEAALDQVATLPQ